MPVQRMLEDIFRIVVKVLKFSVDNINIEIQGIPYFTIFLYSSHMVEGDLIECLSIALFTIFIF